MARLIFNPGSSQAVDFDLSASLVTIGRASTNDIVIDNAWISSHHAKFELSGGAVTVISLGSLHGVPLKEFKRVGGAYVLTDLDSHNGVTVNGKRIQSTRLQSGDVLAFGQLEAVFEESPGSGDTGNPPVIAPPLIAPPTPEPAAASPAPEKRPAAALTPTAAPTATAPAAVPPPDKEAVLSDGLDMGAVVISARGLIQRIDLLDDLMAKMEKNSSGSAAPLRPLRASLLELLHEHGIEPYVVAPGQLLDVATRKRINIMEPARDGDGPTEVAEIFRPGYQLRDGDARGASGRILRKTEVSTRRRPGSGAPV
jgi:pSer/pThr/pTyr-binding forkhead associated (FHA) protein